MAPSKPVASNRGTPSQTKKGRRIIIAKRVKQFEPSLVETEQHTSDDSSYKMPEPEAKHYLDITGESHVPSLNENDLNHFAILIHQEEVLQAENMYNNGHLLTCRIANEQTGGNAFYINAICSSENKRTNYKITMKLVDHMILETQCECANTAPFAQCKHVIVVIYALIDFTNTKTLKASVSFSQSFPIKAEDLVLKANDAKLKTIPNFDPLPPQTQTKEEYNNFFKNLLTNYCATNNSTMPIMQIYPKHSDINLQLDHDYLQKTINDQMTLDEETGMLK